MKTFLRTGVTLAVAICLAPIDPAARADDLLVMPYSCSVVDGRPTLRRSRGDEGYRVLGRREQRTVQACSPVNPGLCRQWTVYRFDLDCGGARVPWVSVVAAAARRDGAWIEEGRLRLDMGPRWGLPPDDPCSRDDRRRSRRLDRYCADRDRGLDDSAIVDMPPGFAPMLGIDGIFVAGGAPGADSPPWAASPFARPESPAAASPTEPPAKAARAEPPQPAAPEPAPKKSARAESEPPSPPTSTLPEPAAKAARVASLPPAPQQPAAPEPAPKKSTRAETEPPSPPTSALPEPAAKGARVASLPLAPQQTAAPEPAPKKSARAESEPPSPPTSALPEPAAKGARIASLPPAPQQPAAPEPAPKKSARAESEPPSPPTSALPEPAAKGARIASLPPAPQQPAKEPAKAASGQEKEGTAKARPQAVQESKPAEAKPAPPSPPPPAPIADPGTPLKPRIINRPGAAQEQASPPPQPPVTAALRTASAPEPAPSPKLASLPPLPAKDVIAPRPPAEKAAAVRDDGASPTLMSALRAPALGVGLAVALLGVLSLVTFVLMRRRERSRLAGAPSRDFAAVSLGAGPRPRNVPAAQMASEPASKEPASTAPPAMPSNWGDRTPGTREEDR
jgi:hypothetical protein